MDERGRPLSFKHACVSRVLHWNMTAYHMKRLFPPALVALFLLAACAESSESPNGTAADPIAEAYPPVTTTGGESWISWNGDGDRMLFGRHAEGWSNHVIWESVRDSTGAWSEPDTVSFSGIYNDRGARFYPALDAVLFSSDRPVRDGGPQADFNLWIAMHDGEEWMEPGPMDALNSEANDFHGSVTEGGVLYFASNRDGGLGRSDLYRAELGSTGYRTAALPAPVNSALSESDVFVDPLERYIVFSRTDAPGGAGGDDLYISYRSADGWSEPENLGAGINAGDYEYGTWITRDGTLYFTTHHDGEADIVSVPVSDVSAFRY